MAAATPWAASSGCCRGPASQAVLVEPRPCADGTSGRHAPGSRVRTGWGGGSATPLRKLGPRKPCRAPGGLGGAGPARRRLQAGDGGRTPAGGAPL